MNEGVLLPLTIEQIEFKRANWRMLRCGWVVMRL